MTRPVTEARPTRPAFLPEPLYDRNQAEREAWRCLQCFDAPCTRACPAGVVVPRFVRMIRSGNLRGAAESVRTANPLARSCGIACPDEQLCGSACVRGRIDGPVAIRRLHRFATETGEARRPRPPRLLPLQDRHVAVVGTGPAGLACAFELRRLGLRVTVFEKSLRIGGVLASTIPSWRFPEEAVRADALFALGPTFRANSTLPPGWKAAVRLASGDAPAGPELGLRLDETVTDCSALAAAYDAIFVAPGLSPGRPRIPGSDLDGVDSAEDFLALCRRTGYRNGVGREVAVIGGGNVAIDAAMAVLQCAEKAASRRSAGVSSGAPGVRVHVLYRRRREDMPAWPREVRSAEEAGVLFQYLVLPEEFIGGRGKVRGVRLRRASPGAPDAQGRPAPVPIEGSELTLPCDQVLLATGRGLDRSWLGGLPVTPGGLLRTDAKTGRVRGRIYAGGDVASPDPSIVAAVRDGKRAARAIAAELGLAPV